MRTADQEWTAAFGLLGAMNEADAWWAAGYAGWVCVMSVVCGLLLWWDKRRAERGGWRVAENTVHLCELLGGWPGSLIARRVLRHKTVKVRYRVMAGIATAGHFAVVGAVVWMRWGG